MNINSVGNNSSSLLVAASASKPDNPEIKKAARTNDGDADDKASKSVPSASVNTNGQTVGQIVSVKA